MILNMSDDDKMSSEYGTHSKFLLDRIARSTVRSFENFVRGDHCTVVSARGSRMCPGVRVPHQFRPR